MITKLKHLSLGVLLIGLTACSSKDNHENNPAVENQAEENTVGSETASEKATVIVPHEKLSPDQNWEKIDSSVLYKDAIPFYAQKNQVLNYRAPSNAIDDFSFSTNHEQLKKQLHLDKNKILVVGLEGRNSENNMLLDLSHDEYFKYVNNLSINYIRALKVPVVEPKQEFEKTQAYEERVKQAQHNSKNKVINYDTELLERVLNHSVPDINFSFSENTHKYDADKELMSIAIEQRSQYGGAIVRSELSMHVQPDLAKTLTENFNRLKLGYVFNMENNQLKLEGVIFYYKNFGHPERYDDANQTVMYTSPVIKPIIFKQKGAFSIPFENTNAGEEIETQPFQDVFTSPLWNFQFGLNHYLSPEVLLKKYAQHQMQSASEVLEEAGGP